MAERSGLTEATDLDGVTLELVQQPLAAWVIPAFLVMMGVFLLTSLLSLLVPLALLCFFALFLGMFGIGLYKPRLRVEISPAEVRLRGWIGDLPKPSERVLPLAHTALTTHHGAAVNDIQLHVLTFVVRGETIRVPSIRCTTAELRELEDRIAGMRLLAAALHGEGEDEVPHALRRLQAARPETERT